MSGHLSPSGVGSDNGHCSARQAGGQTGMFRACDALQRVALDGKVSLQKKCNRLYDFKIVSIRRQDLRPGFEMDGSS